jgi:hypothetical protein
MKKNEAFPSKYLSKEDVMIPITAIIASLYREEFESDEEGKKTKTIMAFEGDIKPIIVNTTNWTLLEAVYGEESDAWVGKPVELYCDPTVMYKGKVTGGVRVRISAGPKNFENFAAAEKYAVDNGVTSEALKIRLKELGVTKFNAVKDSAIVYQIVEEVKADLNAEPL